MPEHPIILEAVEGTGGRQKIWTVSLQSKQIEFSHDADDVHHELKRSEVAGKLELVNGFLVRRTMVATLEKKHVFRFDAPSYQRLQKWLGPPTLLDLGNALKRRMRWSIMVGIILIVTSLPMDGESGSGEDDLPFKPWNCLLGAVLMASGLIHLFKPHRILFLVDSFWFGCLGGWTLYRLFTGGHWSWGLMLAVEGYLIIDGLNQYRRFRDRELLA